MMLGQVPYGHYGCEVVVKTVGLHLPQVESAWKPVALTTQPTVSSPFFISGDLGQAPNSTFSRAIGVL